MIERARRESNAVKVVCSIGYEIAVGVLYEAGLHGSNRKEGLAMTQARFVGPETRSAGETRPGSAMISLFYACARISTFSNFASTLQ